MTDDLRELLPNASEDFLALNCQEKPDSSGTNLEDAFKELAKIAGPYYKDIDDVNGYIAGLRGRRMPKASPKRAGVVKKDTTSGGPNRKAKAKRGRGHPHEDLVNRLIDLLHTYGYRVAGFRPARTDKGWATPVLADGKGFPDLFAARPNRQVAIEAKIPPDNLRREQIEWAHALQDCDVEWYVVTPENWHLMVEVLR